MSEEIHPVVEFLAKKERDTNSRKLEAKVPSSYHLSCDPPGHTSDGSRGGGKGSFGKGEKLMQLKKKQTKKRKAKDGDTSSNASLTSSPGDGGRQPMGPSLKSLNSHVRHYLVLAVMKYFRLF